MRTQPVQLSNCSFPIGKLNCCHVHFSGLATAFLTLQKCCARAAKDRKCNMLQIHTHNQPLETKDVVRRPWYQLWLSSLRGWR